MTMKQAIALSAGNKAKAYDDYGKTIVVQQQFHDESWIYHIWRLIKADEDEPSGVEEYALPYSEFHHLKETFHIDPYADYWQPI